MPDTSPQSHDVPVPVSSEALATLPCPGFSPAPSLDHSQDDRLVIDLREADEFHEARIPGSINLPLSSFRVQAPHLFAPGRILHGRSIVLICRGGYRADLAAEILRSVETGPGLVEKSMVSDLVTVHPGGFKAWEIEGRPVDRGGPVHPGRRLRMLAGVFTLAATALVYAAVAWRGLDPRWMAAPSVAAALAAMWFGLKNVAPLFVVYMSMPWNRDKYL